MKEQYIKLITDKLCVVKDDLTTNELEIIEFSFSLIKEKLEDLKIANDEIKRLQIINANLKSYQDNSSYFSIEADSDDSIEDFDDSDDCGDDC